MWKISLLFLVTVAGLTASCDRITEIPANDSPISPPSIPWATVPSRNATPPSSTQRGGSTPTYTPVTLTPSFEMTATVSRAMNDLAARLGISPDQVEVVSIAPDEFPASNLGCGEFSKQPDRPIPALVTGQRIVLAAGGDQYVYHTHGAQVAYCGPLER